MYDTDTYVEYVEYTTSAAEIALSGVADAIANVAHGQQLIRGEVDQMLSTAGIAPSTGGMPAYVHRGSARQLQARTQALARRCRPACADSGDLI